MNTFMDYDFHIEEIKVACLVHSIQAKTLTHENRANHGLAFHTGGLKEYLFDDGQRILVKQNDIIYLPQYSTYEVIVKIPGDCYAINFTISKDIKFPPFAIKAKNHSSLLEHFKKVTNIWEQQKSGYMLKCMSQLYNIMYVMQQESILSYISKSKLQTLEPAMAYIHENYTKELLNIAELSKLCNITPEYFRRIFKAHYGTSPLNYINNLKITRAKVLLKSKLYSVEDVATLSGYTDVSYFSREFKKATGVCPSRYASSKD